MKKFWSLMLVALVTLGAAACTENSVNENNGQEEQSAGLSFYATIGDDTTRAYIDDTDGNKVWDTIWELGDELMVGSYLFVCTDAATGKFTCEDKNAAELIGQSVRITTEGTKHVRDSRAGKGAFYISNSDVMFDQDANIQLTSETSFFRYTYNGEGNVTLKLEISGTDATTPFMDGENAATEITFSGKGEVFVPFWCDADSSAGISATLSYSIDGVKCKEITKEFAAGKVYNLGTLAAPSEWEISDGTRFFTTDTPDLFVAKKVKLTSNQFCLHKVGDLGWGAGAKYGLVTAGTKSEDKAIGLYSANWAADITISNAATTAHDIYFDKANSRLYVLTVGKTPKDIAAPTHSNSYNIAGTMNSWGANLSGYKFTYSGDNVWHLVVSLKQNDEFKVQLNNDWSTSYGYGNIQSGVGKGYFSGSDNAKVKATATYEIWVIPSHNDAPLYIVKK